MVVVSLLPQGEIGWNDHDDQALHFINLDHELDTDSFEVPVPNDSEIGCNTVFLNSNVSLNNRRIILSNVLTR